MNTVPPFDTCSVPEHNAQDAYVLTCKNYNNTIRWKEGERLENLFEQRCDLLLALGKKNHPAVVTEEVTLSFTELDRRANQLARYLRKQGLQPGERVGLLFDKTYHTYVALLAVLKLNAAYVPCDAGFPEERIRFIVDDAEIGKILTISTLKSCVSEISAELIILDEIEEAVALENSTRLSQAEKGIPQSELSYIIYTSGSTGNPKGVAIEHPSICNFIKVAAEVYGYTEEDRVYQGMTIAFDFSVEELWVPLCAGATLIPGKPETRLVGQDLADFLRANQVTALCCVPTLLATIEEDLPALRFLLLSGEACPQDLVTRWHRPGRTILNAYGPTEATVTATWTEMQPGQPVTIGQPLPTYSVVILAENEDVALAKGESGEIAIAGIGLAKGYVNLKERTQQSFIDDFLKIENNVSGRIYRTGDLGRINENDEIEYQGRIDTQVKIRGYRIELTEIESVLMEIPQIALAVVDVYSPQPEIKELVAYYTLSSEAKQISLDEVASTLRSRLPGYMVPAYFEKMDVIPMLPSDKADRKNLPEPQGPRFVSTANDYIAPETGLQKTITECIADVMKIDRVSITDNFFDDLGGHSLLMAQIASEIRQRSNLEVSMRDIYQHPTVASLAELLDTRPALQASTKNERNYRVASNLQYYGCGTLQLLHYTIELMLGLTIMVEGFSWIALATSLSDIYFRSVSFILAAFILVVLMSVITKWTLIGKWTKREIPIWGKGYFRFWVVKQLINTSPMLIFKGTPLYNVYLRLLGAKIGRNVVIYSRLTPVCTDLFTIGDNSILRKESILTGYNAQSGYIHTGAINIGNDTFIGEASILDIDTSMGDSSQLGHSSSLQSGQHIPAGEHYHGSPAEKTSVDYCTVETKNSSNLRKVLFSLYEILAIFFIAAPLPFIAAAYLHDAVAVEATESVQALTLAIVPSTFAVFFGALLTLLFITAAVPRLLNIFLKADKVYSLYGIHYAIFRAISGLSNSIYFNHVFGDSSYIIHYLKLIGYRFRKIVQTGSNFGTTQKHDNPFLCEIGSGTIISDGLSLANEQVSTSSFKVSRVSIGDYSYLGNMIVYPAGARVGNNCLLATKVMIPLDGPVRENIGLLGSPCFEIPRITQQDESIASIDETTKQDRIRQKNRSNIISAAGFLLLQWLYFLMMTVAVVWGWDSYHTHGPLGLVPFIAVVTLVTVEYFVLTDMIGRGFKKIQPGIYSIYEPYFWNGVERYWKVSFSILQRIFAGTPFKPFITRQMGARVGRKVFDDGQHLSEATLVEIGDYCTLNTASIMQSHSLEEGVFKSDRIKLGKGCTIGVHAFVHYGVVMGDNSILDADSFLMKGEVLEPDSLWRGNPARAR